MSTVAPFKVKPTIRHARKVRDTVRAGLCSGLGKPIPGQMCVEAAVCFAFGLPHGDNPPCVEPAVRAFKVKLNDSNWSSNETRAKGMEKIAIAQLGSMGTVDPKQFATLLAEETIRQIVPIALRAAAKLNPKFAESLEAAAVVCKKDGNAQSARDAKIAAYAAAADAANANADAAATYAAAAATYADANAAATYAATYATAATAAAAAANAAANAAAYAAAYAAKTKTRDKILSLMADIGVKVLGGCGSLGCKWLNLCDE